MSGIRITRATNWGGETFKQIGLESVNKPLAANEVGKKTARGIRTYVRTGVGILLLRRSTIMKQTGLSFFA